MANRDNRLRAFWRNKVKPFWREFEIPVMILVGTAAFIMGVFGFGEYYQAAGTPRPPLDWVFLTIVMFRGIFLQAGPLPLELEIARWIAIFIVMYAAVRVLMALFYEQAHILILRWLTSGHVIICGLGDAGARLAGELSKQGYSVAVIDRNLSREMVQKCKEEGAVILNGDPADKELIRRARADRAKLLIAGLEDDGTNAAVALAARELLDDRPGAPVTCYVHIMDRSLCGLLKADYEFSRRSSDRLRLEFYNHYDDGARALIKEFPPFGEGKAGITVVGMGRLGESLVLRAANEWLFFGGRDGKRLNILAVDPAATKRIAGLVSHYPLLAGACEFRALDADPMDAGAIAAGMPGIAYVCLEKDSDTLSAAIALRKAAAGIPVIACMGRSSGLVRLVDRIGREQGLNGLGFFSLVDAVSRPDVLMNGTREAIARAIHEEYLRTQAKLGFTPESNQSMEQWDKLPETLKESNRHNADHVLVKLAAAGYGIDVLTDAAALDFTFPADDVEKMAVLEHDRWCEERLQQGWKYAPGDKNIEMKTSPYIVPWEKLTEEVRDYDRNVVRGLPMCLARAGFRIYRITATRTYQEIKAAVRTQ